MKIMEILKWGSNLFLSEIFSSQSLSSHFSCRVFSVPPNFQSFQCEKFHSKECSKISFKCRFSSEKSAVKLRKKPKWSEKLLDKKRLFESMSKNFSTFWSHFGYLQNAKFDAEFQRKSWNFHSWVQISHKIQFNLKERLFQANFWVSKRSQTWILISKRKVEVEFVSC